MDCPTTRPICSQHDSARRHHLPGYLTLRCGPLMWLVPPDGDVCCGVDGLYADDRRLLSLWRLAVDGRPLQSMSTRLFSSDGMRAVSRVSPANDDDGDPQVTVTRIRIVRTSGVGEQTEVVNRGDVPFTATVSLSASTDFATVRNARAGVPGPPRPWSLGQGTAVAADGNGTSVTLRLPLSAQVLRPRLDVLGLSWNVTVPPGDSWRTMIVIAATFASR